MLDQIRQKTNEGKFEGVSYYRSIHNRVVDAVRAIKLVRSTINNFDFFHVIGSSSLQGAMLPKVKACKVLHICMRSSFFDETVCQLHKLTFDRIIVTSDMLLSRLEPRLGAEKVIKIAPPIDTDIYKPLCEQVSSNDINILLMGPLIPDRFPAKSVLNALHLISLEYGQVILTLVTKGGFSDVPRLRYIRDIIKKNDLRIEVKHFGHYLSSREKAMIFSNVDAVVFPLGGKSTVDPPLALLEAMSCGAKVISTPVWSIPRIIQHMDNGIIVPDTSTDALQDAISECLSQPRHSRMSRRARESIIKEFDSQRIIQQLVDFYESM
jgi:glycosyltransferase involved in cell wall biosynthesis